MARIPVPQIQQQTQAPESFQDANARGGQLVDYASHVDQGIANVGEQEVEFSQRRENDQANAWAFNAASKFKTDQDVQMRQAMNNAPDGADGFTKATLDDYDQQGQKLIATAPTPRAAKFLTRHLASYRDVVGHQSLSFEEQANKAYRATQIQGGVDSSSQLIFGNPGMYQHELDSLKQSIDQQQLYPQQKDAFYQKGKDQLTQAYWMGRIKNQGDAQNVYNELKGVLPSSPDSIPEKIKSAAIAQGVDPHTALAISHLETAGTLNPDIDNYQGSGAHGLFQMMPATWSQYAAPGDDPADAGAQAKVGLANLGANNKALTKALGRQPTAGELYMTQLGEGFAEKVLKAPADTPVASLGFKETADANGMTGMTAGQARAHWEQVMQTHLAATQGMADAQPSDSEKPAPESDNPALKNLSIGDRMRYLSAAQSQLHKDNSQAKMALEADIRDQIAANRTGVQPQNKIDGARVYSLLPPDQAGRIMQDLHGWDTFAYDKSSLKDMPTEQILQTVKARVPQPGPGFAGDEQRTNQLKIAAKDEIDARYADSMGHAQANGIVPKPDLSNIDMLTAQLSPQFIQGNQVSRDYQTAYKPFDEQTATQLSAMLANSTPTDTMKILNQVHAASDSPLHYRAAMAQITKNNPDAGFIGAMAEHDQGAAALIAQGQQMLKPVGEKKDIALTMPSDDGAAGFKAMWQASGAADAFNGKSNDENQAYNAFKAYYVATVPPGQRTEKLAGSDPYVQKAINVVTGGLAQAGNSRFTIPPPGMKPEDFPDALHQIWGPTVAAAGHDPNKTMQAGYTMVNIEPGVYAATNGNTTLKDMKTGNTVLFNLNGTQQGNYSHPAPSPTAVVPKKLSVAELRGIGR